MLVPGIRFVLAAAILALTLGAAKADVLYFNGPIDGVTSAIAISGVNVVADSFVLNTPSQLQSVEFGAWVPAGHTFNTVDWAILDDIPSSGNVLFSGSAAALNSYLYTNLFNADVYLTGFFLPLINLNAGTYWLELSNATGDGDAIFWDINGGPSRAWNSYSGELTICDGVIFPPGRCSNSFRVNGTPIVTATPEPATLWMIGAFLMLLGLGNLRGMVRRLVGR